MDFQSTDNLVTENEHRSLSSSPTQSAISIAQYGSTDNPIVVAPNYGNEQIDTIDNDKEKNDNQQKNINNTDSNGNGNDVNFFERIRRAKRESRNNNKLFLTSFIGIIIGSLLWIAILFAVFTVPILMIIFGLLYINQCPHHIGIPIVYTVAGFIISIGNIINSADKYSTPNNVESQRWRKLSVGISNAVVNCLGFASFITACVFVYGGGKPSYDSEDSNYCNPTLFLFAYWTLNFAFIFIGLLIVIGICGCFIAFCIKT